MASLTRLGALARRSPRCVRSFTTSNVWRAEVQAAPAPVTVVAQKKPVGGFRGGIVGFLFGFSLASSLAAYNLLEEYQRASAALQASVDELKISTEKVSSHVRRIEAVEKDLQALNNSSASKEEISKVRAEVKKLYDGLHVEFLDLRSHVWGIQQDVHKLSKKDATSLRV